jgi:hypothetical protein
MGTISGGMLWFKQSFRNQIGPALVGTPYTLNLLTAIAVQETFEIWGGLYETQPTDKILAVCVGDTIDAPNRKAFPANKAALLGIPDGDKLFQVARQALEDIGTFSAAYHKIALANPDKFCHGFGIFQYDLQFSRGSDKPFFLNRLWTEFSECLTHCLSELEAARKRAKLDASAALSDEQLAYVAIAYNCGSFDPTRGLKQGFFDHDSGKYYGEFIADYIAKADAIP